VCNTTFGSPVLSIDFMKLLSDGTIAGTFKENFMVKFCLLWCRQVEGPTQIAEVHSRVSINWKPSSLVKEPRTLLSYHCYEYRCK
jgi:hypothetical protein